MGNMGLPMAANLVKNGFTVKGFDMSDKQREKAEEAVSIKSIYFCLVLSILLSTMFRVSHL